MYIYIYMYVYIYIYIDCGCSRVVETFELLVELAAFGFGVVGLGGSLFGFGLFSAEGVSAEELRSVRTGMSSAFLLPVACMHLNSPLSVLRLS